MYTRLAPVPYAWPALYVVVALLAWSSPAACAANVPIYAFGRYEFVVQEGTPFAPHEILGMVRRQTGLPEYPLMLGLQKNLLALNILGPSNRPIQLAVVESTALTRPHPPTMPFLIARSAREGDLLKLWIRRSGASGQATFTLDLRALERRLEGER